MYKFDEKVADELGRCVGDPSLNPYRWFEEEINDLALKFAGLDELPKKALITLAQLAAKSPLDTTALARETECDVAEVETHLDELRGRNLVTTNLNGHEATERGKEVFRALGAKVIIRKRLEMQGRFEHLDALYKAIVPMWHKPPLAAE